MFFFFFDFPEDRPEKDPSLTCFDNLEINSSANVHEIKYNRITDFKDLLRLLVISRCTYLQNRNDIDFNGIVNFEPDLRRLFEPFNERIGTSPNGTSIKDLYCNFLNHYDHFSKSDPDELISKYQPKEYERAPIAYLKRTFGFDEETALIEYYLIYVSFDLYHDEPINEVYQKYVELSNGHNLLNKEIFCQTAKRLFYHQIYLSSGVFDYKEVFEHYRRFQVSKPYQRALLYYYAVLYRDFRAAECKKTDIKGLRVNEFIPHFNSAQKIFTLEKTNGLQRPLNTLFSNTVYPDFKKSPDWPRGFTNLLDCLSKLSLELYLNEFMPYVFVSPSTVIRYLKSVPHFFKHSSDRNVMELIVAFLYARSKTNPQEEFKHYLNKILFRETKIDYPNIYNHLKRFSVTLTVSKARSDDRYYKALSPIKELFMASDGKGAKNISQKLLDVYMYPDFYKDGLDEDVLKRFKKIPALDFLQKIDDNSKDSAVEESILFDTYANEIVLSAKKSALLVQPGYSFLQKWITDYRTKDLDTTVILYDRAIIDCLDNNKLVSWENYHLDSETKPNIEFVSSLDKDTRFDVAISFHNQTPTTPEDLETVIQMMSHHSVLYAVLPEDAQNDERYICLKKWFFNKTSVDHITLFDSQLFGYHPKKKMMIQCSHQSIYTEQRTEIPVTEYEIYKDLHQKSKNGKNVRPDGFLYYLKHPAEKRLKLNSQYLDVNMGIRKMLRRQELPDNITPRERAKEVSPAQDFTVYYTASPHGKAIQVNCYFTRYLDPVKQKNNQKGKKIKESQEIFTLQDESEAKPIILDEILVRDKFRKVVSEEIQSSHKKGFLPDLSLFSYAYAYHEDIKKRFGAYDDPYCINKLSHNRIGGLVFNSPSFSEDLQKALAEMDAISENLITQLSYILDTADRKGFIIKGYDQISETLNSEKKLRKTKAALHKALTKKTLFFSEEKRLMDWLLEMIPEIIVFLGTMIKLFTGLSSPEVCMLSWEDFTIIPESKRLGNNDSKYHLHITKQMSYECTEKVALITKPKYRLVPLPNILVEKLLTRREELIEKYGLSDEEIHILPIISASTDRYNERCMVKSLHDRSRTALIKGAGIDKKSVEYFDFDGQKKQDDLNIYIGDFFVSNFKFHARNDCAMTEGEIAYILGIKAPDTFSNHYCDYSNDLVQMGLAKKLNDWCLKFQDWNGEPVIETKKTFPDQRTRNAPLEPFSPDCTSGYLEFPLKNETAEKIEITISSDRGLTGTLSVYRKGKKNGEEDR